ncbi:MAG TPA: uridine phosphorylase, partial [Nitrospiria bacterium]|nr:uridine phosphorylase [Nitrospiria bacterium]
MSKVYHLDLDRKMLQGATLVLMPGDPFRSPKIAAAIYKQTGVQGIELAWKREYRSFLCGPRGKRILITSTGIGGPSTSIAVDALARLGVG